MENKNTIIALVLMLAVWLGFTQLFPPQQTPENEARVPVAEVATPQADLQPAPKPVEAAESLVPAPPVAGDLRQLQVETDFYKAVFSNSGARLLQFELKHYQKSPDADSANIALIDVSDERLGSLKTSGTDGLAIESDRLYAISTDQDQMTVVGDQSRTVVFSTRTPSGLTVEKVYTFTGNTYAFDLVIRVTNQGSTAVRGNVDFALVHPWDESMEGDRFEHKGPVTLVGEKIDTPKPADLLQEGVKTYSGAVWSAFETKYFISAAVPLDDAAEKIQVSNSGSLVENLFASPYRTIQPGETVSFKYLLYFGPRDLDILKTVNYQLAKAIDFGFFSVLAKPLLHVLKFFYSFFGNYGVAIILLTVIIKLLFWPLTQKSYSSMKAMQKLQPEMQKVREKYKNDKQRLNMELMQLYKENRVNPLGGCLPMIIQIPVFFALYKVLLDTIELRHAPFALWITDLSTKDPYYITPLIMGGTMFIQQKMTPSTMDPTQAKMFMLMPVVFTFLFLNFPSGLVIYWLVNNLLTILQQYFIHRKA